eukprot:2766021-Alexandrium_andersonii.AAC.1
MSASLVGSEMCIRDSPDAMSDIGKTAPLEDVFCEIAAEMDYLLGLLAVSYTHLTLPTICSV